MKKVSGPSSSGLENGRKLDRHHSQIILLTHPSRLVTPFVPRCPFSMILRLFLFYLPCSLWGADIATSDSRPSTICSTRSLSSYCIPSPICKAGLLFQLHRFLMFACFHGHRPLFTFLSSSPHIRNQLLLQARKLKLLDRILCSLTGDSEYFLRQSWDWQ